MRRLLCVCAASAPGGAEIGLLRLLRRLDDRGWVPTVTTPRMGPLAERVGEDGWQWRSLDAGRLGAGPRSAARAVFSWPHVRHLAGQADVVYLNGGVPGRLLPALRGARTVLHVHDLVDRVPRHWRWADVVLADSQAVADRLTGLDAHVVHCPVELDPPHVWPPWAVGGTRPIVGFVGRIEPRKGVMDLVHAAPAIRERAPGARVLVVGDDPYQRQSPYLLGVRAAPQVEQHPWVPDGAGLMRHLDVLVLPSHSEPFGTVVAEAMAVGTPVVATRVGGVPEVVEDGVTGLLVEPGDPAGLAEAVVRVLERREEMGRAARESARRFGVAAYADRVEALLPA